MKVWQMVITLMMTGICPGGVSEVTPAELGKLEQLLGQQQWQAASDLTWKIFNPEGKNTRDMEPIACGTIDNVDRLWNNYSDGRYGFGVQRQIWEEIAASLASTAEPEQEAEPVWPTFYQRLGWGLTPEEALETAKRGYFPVSESWMTGEILTFGCQDAECKIPNTVVEETIQAWDVVRSRWEECQK
ncbi:MAG TPA: GUN4 domain-containing protein [Oscillatoriaceae cyanobacterium M33_DOE_052]|uniref:GUN4-like domain-containing protein n=1 Tax=Planktothricoides sp. SpSt-374 TaxID=2282167 RepID=A0A7C3VND3_9CYAN|nr:GUN4 domain-containing protein [Oscillatoriaceae cyanobacterium M33_DOE_052]